MAKYGKPDIFNTDQGSQSTLMASLATTAPTPWVVQVQAKLRNRFDLSEEVGHLTAIRLDDLAEQQ